MATLARVSLLLVIVLVSLSAYLRLSHSGIGCPGWPSCYGQIGSPPGVVQETDTRGAYERMGEQANEPLAWATPLHRLVASVLGLLILFLNIIAFVKKRDRVMSFALLVCTVYLAVLGIRSGSLHSPAVIMGNLTGGFLMLTLLGWMVLRSARAGGVRGAARGWAVAALILLGTQVLLGGLTSANFAATACMTLPDCNGAWLPGPELLDAFDLSRIHQTDEYGIAIGGAERAAIHMTHRLGAMLTMLALLVAGVLALRSGEGNRWVAIIILVLAVAEVSIGVSAIVASLPIALAVAHNWVAALLVLALLRLLAPQRNADYSPAQNPDLKGDEIL